MNIIDYQQACPIYLKVWFIHFQLIQLWNIISCACRKSFLPGGMEQIFNVWLSVTVKKRAGGSEWYWQLQFVIACSHVHARLFPLTLTLQVCLVISVCIQHCLRCGCARFHPHSQPPTSSTLQQVCKIPPAPPTLHPVPCKNVL